MGLLKNIANLFKTSDKVDQGIKKEKPLSQYEKALEQRRLFIQRLKDMDKSKVLCLDVETTGLKPSEDEILQLSIINGNREVLFNEYIKPKVRKKWPKAQETHGITTQMVKNKATIDEHIETINYIIANSEVIVGYNISKFDIEFIKAAGIEVPKTVDTFDVMLFFSNIYGEWDERFGEYKWQKLEKCAKYYGYKKEGEYHDSLEDVKATLHCYYAMLESNLQPKRAK